MAVEVPREIAESFQRAQAPRQPGESLWEFLARLAGDPALNLLPSFGAIRFADPVAAELGLKALAQLPLRLRDFLLRHPETVEVGSASIPEMLDRLPLGPGRIASGALVPGVGTAEAPHALRILPGFADEAVAMEELLHAGDYLATRLQPSLGQPLLPLRAARPIRAVLGREGYPPTEIATETFGSLAWRGSQDAARREALFRLLQSPAARARLLQALDSLSPPAP